MYVQIKMCAQLAMHLEGLLYIQNLLPKVNVEKVITRFKLGLLPLLKAVVGDEIRRAPRVTLHGRTCRLRKLLDPVAHGLDARDALEGHQVGGETSNMGRGHAGAAQHIRGGISLDANTAHQDARSEDVDKRTKVGEVGHGIIALVNGADCDCGGG